MKLSKSELLQAYKFFHKDMLYEKVNIKLLNQFFELENKIIPREVAEMDEKEIEKKVKDKISTVVNGDIQQKVDTYKVVKKVERETSLDDTVLEFLNAINYDELNNKDISKFISEGIVEKSNKTSFSSDTFDDDKIRYNNFIDLSIKDYFIDYVMLDSLGRKMDSKLPDYLYANRMNNREARTLFKPYFLGYSAYTNDLIVNVKRNIQNNNDIIIFQIDFTRFYYNIDVKLLKQRVNNFIKENDIVIKSKERQFINRIFKVHEKYNELESVQGLPLGLKSSGLFSNIFAMQFDEKFIKERPLFYGRYVDDISLVFKKEYDVDGTPLEEITSYITDETLLELFKSSEVESVQNVSINKSKTVTIDIPKGVDVNYITEFERKLKKTGSGFNLIFDPTGIGLKISQIYSNNNSIVTKSSQMIDMKKNTTSVKMFIGAMYDWYKMILLKEKMNISESYKVIYERYWAEFISCVDDLTLIELSSYWLNLFILDAVFNQEKPLTKKIEMLVKDSKHSSLKEILKITKEINDKYLSNSNKTKDMLTSARLKDFRNYPKECNQKENFNVLTSNGYKAYSCLHRVKIYEEQIFKFESQLIDSSNRASFDIECINEINSLNISESLMTTEEQERLLSSISHQDFRAFYPQNEKDVKKYEEEIKVSLSVEKEFSSYYENFLHGLNIKSSGYVNFLQKKMTASFNDAVKEKSNLLVYPEHSIPFVTLQNLVKKSIENNIIIMGGLVPLKTNDNVILNLHITIIPIKKVGEI
ncbi:MAG: RNA-directed DNA polymerase [Bacilli bacterium]